uniref:Uncharacterized protein n=1 Tax=Panagrolaimus sp. PS1159 TaxID=55785 RepID=A0AC35GSR1_9BILA
MEIFKKNNPVINYYLPDYNLIRRGQIKQSLDSESFKDLSTISLGVERFVLPETIFFPEIVDCDQIGLKEAINRTCNGVFNYNLFGRYMLKNIIVSGGNASIPGLKERLCHDLSNAFETYDVPENIESCINISSHPISEPWFAAQYLINNNVPSFLNKFVSKKEYHEHGNRICDERFIDYAPKEWYEHVEDGPFVDENGMTVMDTDDEFETPVAETTCDSKAEKPVTFENQITDQIDTASPSNAAAVVQDQFSNDILIPQSVTNDVDTDIMEIDYVPSATRPIIRTILKPRRAVPSVGTVSMGQQPTVIQKVVASQRLIKCPDQNSHLPNVQYYTAINEGSKPSRFIQLRPARIQPNFQQQQRFQSRLPVIPSSSIIRIRSPIASTSNIRSPNQQIPSSEMPILHPQIARQVPIMLPRGMLPSSSIGGPGPASFRGRTILVRRAIPRNQYIALQQRHQQPSQQSVLVIPSTNFQPQQGLEEEYESEESGPSTPL